ncbi:unnamed protein product [Angiostrongylus costaricensis]|uniref:SGNH_hydro domain-containing protein n=1 Tax=Angiostrongylus costaricensis TaxID=334426 RepID=A0A0R3PKS7_ANGCS|nr:unnamed protein product [Angiostrongylus costaricensis]
MHLVTSKRCLMRWNACRILLGLVNAESFLLYSLSTQHPYQAACTSVYVFHSLKCKEVNCSQSKDVVNSQISSAFSNKQTFSCPLAKPVLHTVSFVIEVFGSFQAGRGLWDGTDVEFRGAAFPIGGDANIDGLVTIPNILLEFNQNLEGVAHGMGTRSRLPDYQLNVAESNTETESLPEQATELIRRLNSVMSSSALARKWVLVTIATGTEELCNRCDSPDHSSIRRALGILRKGILKAFVVLLGPVHVASSYKLHINLLKPRCRCLESISTRRYRSIIAEWRDVFVRVQNEFNSLNHSTFGVLAIPLLSIDSRVPESLLVPGKSLLNRKGHTYAAKWLWNRLIAGPSFNFSSMTFSQDSYYCPSVSCPYFRTVQNLERCTVMTEMEYQNLLFTTSSPRNGTTKVLAEGCSMLSSTIVFPIIYCHEKRVGSK